MTALSSSNIIMNKRQQQQRSKNRRMVQTVVVGGIVVCWLMMVLNSSQTLGTPLPNFDEEKRNHHTEQILQSLADVTEEVQRMHKELSSEIAELKREKEAMLASQYQDNHNQQKHVRGRTSSRSKAASPAPASFSIASIDDDNVDNDISTHLHCATSIAKADNSAKALFCRAVELGSIVVPRADELKAIWKAARAIMPPTTIETVLACAVKTDATLYKNTKVHLWAPRGDVGLKTVLKELNGGNKVAEYGFETLPEGSLGPGKLYVDAGSNLGLVTLLVSLQFPGTDVISIEAASPTWLLQQLNLRMNLPRNGYFEKHVFLVQAGLGATDGDIFPMMWRPSSTTSTRGWTPKYFHKEDDIELQVTLRSLRSILRETKRPADTVIDFLKIDCEGCEYNAIPSMTDKEFDAIKMGVGELHWGYIPDQKKPSSERAGQTHERLCRFRNFASQAKECCAFPDVRVIDAHAQGGGNPTVSEIAGSLCDDFDGWARRQKLHDVPDDTGWLSTDSSMA